MLSPIAAYDTQGLNTALVSMTDALAATNKGTAQIKTLSMMDLYSSMSTVAPVTANPSIWSVTEDYCYNRDSKETCSDPENHFRFDMFHPSTVPNYNTAMYISDAIARFWPL
ncbi:hypothetical protein DSO57_1031693 [Entomophthora muscae]|uniref:Uncharacterized protein n=1 Tax=Entomophthora muscae TaxID=34485 RepID=A0ACC2UAF1_9FUNG|nr:hypothetical protein DSO57_1031693 [Entomophthora muscae]